MNTLELAPPEGAIRLLRDDLNNWTTREDRPAGWRLEDGVAHVVLGTGDIMTDERFTDFYLHLEFRCLDMREATGQAKANSGVFL